MFLDNKKLKKVYYKQPDKPAGFLRHMLLPALK